MEATGAPIVSDGEQRVSSFATYPLADTLAGTGLAPNLAGDGQYFAIFTDGHHRPFSYPPLTLLTIYSASVSASFVPLKQRAAL